MDRKMIPRWCGNCTALASWQPENWVIAKRKSVLLKKLPNRSDHIFKIYRRRKTNICFVDTRIFIAFYFAATRFFGCEDEMEKNLHVKAKMHESLIFTNLISNCQSTFFFTSKN